MKKLLSSLWALLLLISAAQAQYERLKIQPAQPKQGEKVQLSYMPSLKAAQQIFINAFLVRPDATTDQVNVEMKKGGDIWEGTFTTDNRTVSVFFYIRAGESTDNNGGSGYYTLLTDNKGAVLPHAQGALGVFYETMGMRLLEDRSETTLVNLLTQELKSFPENKQQYLFNLMGNLLSKNRKDEAQAYMADFEALIQKTDLKEKELSMAARLCQMLGKQQDAARLSAEELQRFPTGNTAKMALFSEFRKETDPAKKRTLLAAYREKMGIDESLFPNMAAMVLQDYFNQSQWQEGVAFVHSIPLDSKTASIHLTAAEGLAKAATPQYDMALPIAQSVIDVFTKQLEELKTNSANKNISSLGNIVTRLAMARNTAGGILLNQGKAAEALPLLEEAVKSEEAVGLSVRENYAIAVEKAGDPAKGLESIAKLVRENKGNDVVKTALKNIYTKAKGSETGWDEYLKGLEAEAKKKLTEKIAAKMIDEPAPGFTLTNLAGETVSLEGLRGKVVVIDFWATWCGPCIASFPGMKKAQDSFKGRNDVQFLFINSWERVEDKKKQAGDFIAKKEYDFNVPMDEDNGVIGSYKVTGIPTKFVIDKQGRIRFKSIGYNGSTDLTAQEMQVMIDLLAEM